MDVYGIITEKIITLLEQGIVPWRRPWTETGYPRNLVSMKPYRGISYFLLSASKYTSPYWLTMRQANELGGHVRKGEESTAIVFWKVDDARDDAEDASVNERNDKAHRRFLLRYYRVWNLEQCELPAKLLDKLPKIDTYQHDPIETAERIIAEMSNPPKIQYGGSQAFYSPSTDCITLPRVNFSSVLLNFMPAAYHELIHSTGARKGLREKDFVTLRRLAHRSIPRKS